MTSYFFLSFYAHDDIDVDDVDVDDGVPWRAMMMMMSVHRGG